MENTNMKWRSGEPPAIGWWEASPFKTVGVWRWWDGREWSCGAEEDDCLRIVMMCASYKNPNKNQTIYWRTFYPKNARVKRHPYEGERDE